MSKSNQIYCDIEYGILFAPIINKEERIVISSVHKLLAVFIQSVFILSVFSTATFAEAVKVVIIPLGESAVPPNQPVDTSSGNAIAREIKAGKKAWVDGLEVTGTHEAPRCADINFCSSQNDGSCDTDIDTCAEFIYGGGRDYGDVVSYCDNSANARACEAKGYCLATFRACNALDNVAF